MLDCAQTVRKWSAGFQVKRAQNNYDVSMMQKAVQTTLESHLTRIAKETVRKRGRRLADLRFAKRTDNGYAFFYVLNHPWEILEEITQELVRAFPELSYAQAVDTVSEWANSPTDQAPIKVRP